MIGKRWNGKGYNKEWNKEFEIKYGNVKGKEYNNYNSKWLFEGEDFIEYDGKIIF